MASKKEELFQTMKELFNKFEERAQQDNKSIAKKRKNLNR